MPKQAPPRVSPHVTALQMYHMDPALKTQPEPSLRSAVFLELCSVLQEPAKPRSFSEVTFVVPAGLLTAFLVVSFQDPDPVDARQRWFRVQEDNRREKREKGSRGFVQTKQDYCAY